MCKSSQIVRKVRNIQRKHNVEQKGASAALKSTEAQLSVATAAIGYAYQAGGGADSELKECQRLNEALTVDAAAAAREVSVIIYTALILGLTLSNLIS